MYVIACQMSWADVKIVVNKQPVTVCRYTVYGIKHHISEIINLATIMLLSQKNAFIDQLDSLHSRRHSGREKEEDLCQKGLMTNSQRYISDIDTSRENV